MSTHPADPTHASDPATPSRSVAVPVTLSLLVLGIAAAVILLGVLPALRRTKALEQSTTQRTAELPRVVFVETTAVPATARAALPARLDALQSTALYAQVSGYLGPLQADLGDAVKQDQLLVAIETPILDRQIEQNASARNVALAKIELAEARLQLARASLARLRSVGDARAVSQQALDEAAANEKSDAASLAAARADLGASEADGRRLAAQKALARIVAPFDGEVTARGFDTGALIVADRTDAGLPIYRITNRQQIRAFIDVPQSLAPGIAVGGTVDFTVKELPARTFTAQIVRASPALDPVTRTRLVEARIPNDDHALLPGMFAEASLVLPRSGNSAMVPGEAIIIREGKQTLAIIDPDDTLRYQVVQLGRDNGTLVEVASGVTSGSRVAVGMSKQLPPGIKVQPVKRAGAK